jgi:hypothetical protein
VTAELARELLDAAIARVAGALDVLIVALYKHGVWARPGQSASEYLATRRLAAELYKQLDAAISSGVALREMLCDLGELDGWKESELSELPYVWTWAFERDPFDDAVVDPTAGILRRLLSVAVSKRDDRDAPWD